MDTPIKIIFMIILVLIIAMFLLIFISDISGQGQSVIENLYKLLGLL